MDLGVEFREGLWEKMKRLQVSIGKKNLPERSNTRAKASVSGGIGQVEELSLGSWKSKDKAWYHIKRLLRFGLDDF